MSFRCELHPVYGAVPKDGDPVEPGELLGLSVDGVATVAAPFAGTVRLIRHHGANGNRLLVEILPTASQEKEAGAGPTSSITR